MNKKAFRIILLISILVLITGVILIADNTTPLEYCNHSIEYYGKHDWVSYQAYVESLDNIEKYKTLYNSGIILTILGGISLLSGIIGVNITKKEKSTPNNIDTYMD